ncbi:GntR family transcriptional regulator [Saccharopolyspora hirsuta]|uniref:GntR family transcriptional regulator n=2 Tax=Saccharopolyspora hirsuta TaxID=1837 RepID=A0A5M7C1Y6_SACHI|nr:GntR family transcriptional regulator [Saccharopolyspora hirsuta]
MEPRPTAVAAPMQLRIADDIRMQIERGELTPGDPLPTLHELAAQWGCSLNSARSAISLLKQQGLITGGRGKAPVVRTQPRQVVRSSNRHQVEKDLVLAGEDERGQNGVAENDLGVPLDDLKFTATHEVISADADLAEGFGIEPGADVLRRVFELADPKSGHLEAWSVSYIPYDLVSAAPEIFESTKPHPGGTQHQLYAAAGIELARIDDEVTSAMPTTVTAQQWGMDPGIPMIRVRRISIDTQGRTVEISDADFPADRTKLHFSTPLTLW